MICNRNELQTCSERLDYITEAIEGKVFGQEVYPELYDKAAVYMFSVISNHIFQDGNKRTGLQAALLFLKMNGYRLKNTLVKIEAENQLLPTKGENANEILFQFTMELASGQINLDQCREWFKVNVEAI